MCSGFPIKLIFRKNKMHVPFIFVLALKVWLLLRSCCGDKRSQLLATTGCSARGVFGPLGGDVQPSPLHSLLQGS